FKWGVNNYGSLNWEFEELLTLVDFLGLTISVKGSNITTKTYQQTMNLYQYTPLQSAHPPGMIKGIICGLMQNYFLQNTKQNDYHTAWQTNSSHDLSQEADTEPSPKATSFSQTTSCNTAHSPSPLPSPIPTKNGSFLT
ncbi:hypothetical protein ACHAWF_006536, partial [Thalassiosira exigua]